MDCAVGLALLEGITLSEQSPGVIAFDAPVHLYRQRMTLTNVTPGLRAALKKLETGSVPAPVLMAQVMQSDGMAGLGRLNQYLRKLEQYTFLTRQLQVNGIPWATTRPLSSYYRFEDGKIDKTLKYVLSKFVVIRNDNNRMMVECPLGHAQVECQSPSVMGMLHALRLPCNVDDAVQSAPGSTEESVAAFMNFLACAEALAPAPDSKNPEAGDPLKAPWEFHDLLFHSRSRLGRHDRPYGGTFPFKDKFPSLPIIKKAMSDRIVPLYKPDIEQLKKTDSPFTDVLERRCSIREHGDTPLTVQQLGEFLYRAARVKEMYEEAGASFRPSAAGGALHELEIYAFVDRVEGLAQGMYHYNPLEHNLEEISGQNPLVNTLLRVSAVTARQEKLPQVLFIISARFQRLQLKYQSMTYALVLKNLGALYQTMYLVGTAMGLATTALGGGHADMFAQAAGVNYLEESSVGEFLLGTRNSEPFRRQQIV